MLKALPMIMYSPFLLHIITLFLFKQINRKKAIKPVLNDLNYGFCNNYFVYLTVLGSELDETMKSKNDKDGDNFKEEKGASNLENRGGESYYMNLCYCWFLYIVFGCVGFHTLFYFVL